MKKKVAVILSGCGVYDGAEIHEATLTLLVLSQKDVEYEIFAPDINQHHVINHITGEEMPEFRNVLIEAARIARGNIQNIEYCDPKNFDAIIIPGGFGVAKNLSNFAFKGKEQDVLESFKNLIYNTLSQKKPIGAMCIAPAILAKIIKDAKLTIGTDKGTATAIDEMGCKHILTNSANMIVVDEANKIVSTACYMENYSISEIYQGIVELVEKVIELS